MRRAWRAAVVCLMLLSPVTLFAQHDGEIALLYVEAAYDAYGEARFDRAGRLAAVAREFAPESSDALYVSALVAAEDRSTIRTAIELAGRAADAGTWRMFGEAAANVLRARLLNRVGAHQSAATFAAAGVLEQTRLPPDTPAALRASTYYELIRALDALDRLAERDEVLERARDRFPDDPRFFGFVLRSEPFPSVEYRREIERLMDVGSASDFAPVLDELIFEYGMRAPVAQEASWALSQLDDRGWRDARVAVLWLDVDAERAVERFVDLDGWADYRTGRRLEQRLDAALAERLRERASAYDGVSLVDDDNDGIWNERISVERGTVVRWERDADQDGVNELDVVFDDEEPASVTVASPGAPSVELEYEQYPFVGRATISAEIGSEVFVVRPRSLRFETVRGLPEAGPLFASDLAPLEDPRAVDRGELVSAATRIDLVRDDGTVAERTYREGGAARQVQRDGDGDGAWDHLLLTDGGFATSGLRDLDGDGYFEVAEGYRGGRLVALAVDADDDREPEVFEREPGVPVREWDLNGDGVIDVREFSWWTDSVIREFPLVERRR